MRARALSIHTIAVGLGAISFASSAGAGLVLCDGVTDHAMVQAHCGDNGSKKGKLSIDYLFDAATPAPTWVLLGDVKAKSGEPKLDERLLHHWHRVDLSNGWSFGAVFVHGGKWAQAQLHGGRRTQNVPEPSSLALLGIGLLGAALSRRFKRS